MSYQALARKWRPRQFADVVGQAHVVDALRNALEQNRVHHAFLFSGTRGVGKTTLARVLAKALNCEQGPAAEPCGACSNCQSVDEGRFIDLIEIDAASRTRVDDTREILDNVQYAATLGRYKIYLIDEVHMLSGHSFNALLKTLEEPPPHVKFLLATTDPQKLPATILSRCLQFNLRALSVNEIVAQLQKIIEAEGLASDEEGLKILARAAAGSMRDALSLMDQSIAFGSGAVMGQDVREMLGMIEADHVDRILRALAAHDGKTMMAVVQQMSERAVDYVSALDELLIELHHASLFQTIPDAVVAKQADSELVRFLAEAMSPEDIQLYYQIGLIGKRDLPLAPDAASGFEMSLLRMLSFRPQPDGVAVAGSDQTPSVAVNTKEQKKREVRSDVKSEIKNGEPMSPAPEHVAESAPVKNAEPRSPLSQRKAVSASAQTDERKLADFSDSEVWATFVAHSGFSGVTKELAMNISPDSFDPASNSLTMSIAPSLVVLQNKARVSAIEKALAVYCGSPVKLQFIETAEQSGETPSMAQTRREQEEKEQALRTLMADPTVQDLVSAFDATVIPESVTPGNQQRKSE